MPANIQDIQIISSIISLTFSQPQRGPAVDLSDLCRTLQMELNFLFCASPCLTSPRLPSPPLHLRPGWATQQGKVRGAQSQDSLNQARCYYIWYYIMLKAIKVWGIVWGTGSCPGIKLGISQRVVRCHIGSGMLYSQNHRVRITESQNDLG